MASNTQKTFDLASDGSTVLKFRGHPNYDAFRVEVDGGAGTADVNYYVDSDDELDNVDTGSATQLDSVDGLTSGDTDGTKVAGRTVLVEVIETTTSDPVNGTVYGHDATDNAENATAFANR